jgi:SAM-dependent methyltransferase
LRKKDVSWLEHAPEAVRQPLADYLEGGMPISVGLMHLLMAAENTEQARIALTQTHALLEDATAARRLAQLIALWDETPQACELVKRVLACVRHDDARQSESHNLSAWAAAFDETAAISAEAGVALYSLGRRDLLDRATDEVVAAMRRWNLLNRGSALDVGCGIGRIVERIAPEMDRVVGIDISGAMLATARQRCGRFPNIHLLQTSGHDLALFRDAAFDLIYAIDTFPYVVLSGRSVAERHMNDFARVLRPGGALLVLNYSYSGDLQQDRQDIAAAARITGLEIVRDGTRDFTTWDAVAFQMVRRR